MMQTKLLATALCLLGAVILCKGQSSSSAAPSVSPTINPSESSSTEGPGGSTVSAATSGSTVVPTTGAVADEGLSDGAIAGIVIGSLAGVAGIGGGVYGLLKYTGKI